MGCIRVSGIFRVGVEGGRLIRIHMVFRVFSSEFGIARYNNILYRLYLRVLRLQVGPRLQWSGQKVKLESDHPNNTGKMSKQEPLGRSFTPNILRFWKA